MNQQSILLDYLYKHDWISPLKAREDLGITRLAARIYDLKEAGVPLRSRMRTSYSGKKYKEYGLAWHSDMRPMEVE